jgi:hypothetical protein
MLEPYCVLRFPIFLKFGARKIWSRKLLELDQELPNTSGDHISFEISTGQQASMRINFNAYQHVSLKTTELAYYVR